MKNEFMVHSNDEIINIYAGVDKKRTIKINKEFYLLKLPSIAKYNNEASYTNNIFSEYIGCHVFESVEWMFKKPI